MLAERTFRGFLFLSCRIFCGCSRRIFSPHFCGGKGDQNISPRKSPAKCTAKVPDTFLQRDWAKNLLRHCVARRCIARQGSQQRCATKVTRFLFLLVSEKILVRDKSLHRRFFHAEYDWTTGVPDNRNSGKKKEHKDELFGSGDRPLGWGESKKFVPSLESLSFLGFEERNLGCPGNFAGMSRTPGGVQKVCAIKSSCAFFPCFVLCLVGVETEGF